MVSRFSWQKRDGFHRMEARINHSEEGGRE
jgi:hypothetical protein